MMPKNNNNGKYVTKKGLKEQFPGARIVKIAPGKTAKSQLRAGETVYKTGPTKPLIETRKSRVGKHKVRRAKRIAAIGPATTKPMF